MRHVHIESLVQAFPGRVYTISNDANGLVLRVDQSVSTLNSEKYVTMLFITLPPGFPVAAPLVGTAPFLSDVPVQPLAAERQTHDGEVWNSSRVLGEYVQDAVRIWTDIWGNVVPPTIESVAQSLESLSDATITDIASNEVCRETFVHQLPFAKRARDESEIMRRDLERAVTVNLSKQPVIAQLTSEVAALGERCKQLIAEVQTARKEMDTYHLGSSSATVTALEAEIKVVADEMKSKTEQLQTVDASANEAVINEYFQLCVRLHTLDLMKRSLVKGSTTTGMK